MKKLPFGLVLLAFLSPVLRALPPGVASIPYVTSQAQFTGGDTITLQEVFASSPNLAPGDTVVVRGSYSLQSQSTALLAINLTSSGPSNSGGPNSHATITSGSGTFELEFPIQQTGSLHVTFYSTTTGASFGGIYFAPPGASGGVTNPGGSSSTPPPISTSGLVSVPFSTSRVQYDAGDSITLQQVLASSPRMEPGDTVVVRGAYTLQSRDKAVLMVVLTANAPGASERVGAASRKEISAGSGTFELEYTIQQPGSLHVSFYPAGSGSSFGGIYFAPPGGTGNSNSGTSSPALVSPATNTGLLGNLSIRSVVSPGTGTLVAGVSVTDRERYVLIRAVGPSLSKFGVAGSLAKPQLSVYNASGEQIASTGSWSSAFTGMQRAGIELLTGSVGAFALSAGSDDAVLHLRLVPGGYTIMVASADGQSGVALLEVYASSTFTLPATQ